MRDDIVPPAANLLDMTTQIVAAYVGKNEVGIEHVAELIRSVHKSLSNLGVQTEVERPVEKPKAATTITKSVTDDYIVCLEDGKKLKMLKRYLRSKYDLSPEEYRKRWNLPGDYPMVAPNYAKRRSEFAKQIGLGRGVRGRS
ncbi:MAG: MucR family transcriptional regulator [Hyphomonadaceae bacterium]|nr:MucR family transcriptional regulator [Hyphomonadaceae bacterium]